MAKKIDKKTIMSIIVILVVGGSLIWWLYSPGEFDTFAKCLVDKNAVFYGAFWCEHCKEQKKLFGKSAKYLPYVECSTPDEKDQLQICREKNIQVYPTWQFADKSIEEGWLTLQRLSDKTGCQLPQ